jgi:triosephosphate isomerase (TIM)
MCAVADRRGVADDRRRMPNRYLIANWKMNVPPEGIEPFARAISAVETSDPAVIVAPPFPYLKETGRWLARHVALAGQNCSDQPKGAFTGEVSGAMLRDCGARYVIIGHSERRTIYGETDAIVARKLSAAIAAKLTPVLCIGEDLRTRDAGHVARFLAGQIKAAADAPLPAAETMVVAYEPIWAIGTGRNASGSMVAETVASIRESLDRFWPSGAGAGTSLLYGGSVTPENVADLTGKGGVDGFLVGGASLDPVKFLGILAGMRGAAVA